MTTEFVQIGDWAFNPALVADIVFKHEQKIVLLFFGIGDQSYEFYGDDYNAFMRWWEERARPKTMGRFCLTTIHRVTP